MPKSKYPGWLGPLVKAPVVFVIVSLIAAGAVGLAAGSLLSHTVTTVEVVYNTNTTSTNSLSSSLTTSSSSTCNPSLPLKLVSVSILTSSFNANPAISTNWHSCANQPLQFDILANNLNATLSTYGQMSTVPVNIGTNPTPPNTVQNSGSLTVDLTLYFPGGISPNAIIQSVQGNLTATDPVTQQAISQETIFVT